MGLAPSPGAGVMVPPPAVPTAWILRASMRAALPPKMLVLECIPQARAMSRELSRMSRLLVLGGVDKMDSQIT